MKEWQVYQHSDPQDALKLTEAAVPTPGEGEVVIKMEAAALNFFDILQCQGKYQENPPLPFVPGAEISGEIVNTGNSRTFKTGQRVLATPQLPEGGWREFVKVREEDAFPIPDSLSYNQAASMFITYQTAYYALHRCGNLGSGETLLVHAGAGGVGSAAIQLGKAAGATVIATAGSEEKVSICLELGADYALNYRNEDFVEKVKEYTNGAGADVIFDPVGGEVFDRSRKCIAFEGRILAIGFASGTIPKAPINHALIKNYSIVGVHFGLFRKKKPEKVREAHDVLMDLYEKGDISPLVSKEYSFADVVSALEVLGNRKSSGKLVITAPE
ncbi:NADPH:quinone oxidoreductase family protein [Thalassobacillus sp. C254]|uniref:NADPH:quinone oxidoreductase family protein n=1 Tax=Thalassobacillus sp. C254 TaxID=1225341 RepID=UPI0006D23C68|nr:NADPH:quinone oxidoreductase family protein [Thalassobacillus sp. C254]